jgi:hypothetical protein
MSASVGKLETLPPRNLLIRVLRLRLRLLLAIILAVGISLAAVSVFYSGHQNNIDKTLSLNGLLALDAKQLRELVVANGLNVYWVGPEKNGRYLINASNPLQISIRYLPKNQDISSTRATYRDIETFVQRNAFTVIQEAATTKDGVGFINGDGNAIYYNKLEPSNVYIGIKHEDLQIQVFDPQVDQALAIVMQQGKLIRIR